MYFDPYNVTLDGLLSKFEGAPLTTGPTQSLRPVLADAKSRPVSDRREV
jgi:hypothetical protein